MTTDTAPAEQDDPADYNLDGYRMGYAARFPAGITGIELRPDSDDPNSADGANIPDTRRGRFRVAFPNGWVDGYQDGSAYANAVAARIAAGRPLP